jgi:hypothetical protein
VQYLTPFIGYEPIGLKGKSPSQLTMRSCAKSPDEQAKDIESKCSLLAYLRSGPQNLTIESYLCLTCILSEAGWHYDTERWTKGDGCLTTSEAAIMELEQQVASDRDRLLRQTVRHYVPEGSGNQLAS